MSNAQNNKASKEHQPSLTNPFTSTRRQRNSLEEMIPMLESRRGTFLGVKNNFEFSVRDTTDATAKRGFRVQVPKRMLLYVLLVFFVLPLGLFLFVEVHKAQQKREFANARHHPNLSSADANMTIVESVTQTINEISELTTDTMSQINNDIASLTASSSTMASISIDSVDISNKSLFTEALNSLGSTQNETIIDKAAPDRTVPATGNHLRKASLRKLWLL